VRGFGVFCWCEVGLLFGDFGGFVVWWDCCVLDFSLLLAVYFVCF